MNDLFFTVVFVVCFLLFGAVLFELILRIILIKKNTKAEKDLIESKSRRVLLNLCWDTDDTHKKCFYRGYIPAIVDGEKKLLKCCLSPDDECNTMRLGFAPDGKVFFVNDIDENFLGSKLSYYLKGEDK